MSIDSRQVSRYLNFTFEKTSSEIVEASRKKIDYLMRKVEERQKRIANLRGEYGIDDAALIQIYTQARLDQMTAQYAYTSNSVSPQGKVEVEQKTIGAGVVKHLLEESDQAEAEKAAAEKLRAVAANIRPLARTTETGAGYKEDSFQLSYDELDYLGFGGKSR